ncbi:MAG: helix-turn-helix domain-containing protein [Oscillospiraceae bacterium]
MCPCAGVCNQNGNPCLAVDEEIRRRIETKLIVAILSFDLN